MVDKFRRAFTWVGTETVQGGQCLVAWSKVTRPKELGGLGVLDLTTLGYALQLWWVLIRTSILWLQSFLSLRYLVLSYDHKHNN
jgi:hypothetical protein